MEPATLTIRSKKQVPVAEQVAFGYYGEGDDAHLVPLSPDPRRIEIPILHFSGYGFARAAPNDPGRQALQRAEALEARLASRLAEAMARQRARGEEAASEELTEVFREAMLEYYDQVLRSLMRTAETDERMAACALQRWIAWERQLQLYGLSSDDDEPVQAKSGGAEAPDAEVERRRNEARASTVRILENAYEEGLKRIVRECREEHDFSGAQRLIALSRQMELTGIVREDDGRLREALEELKKCMTFEVEFRSIFDHRAEGVHDYHHVEARVPVEVTAEREGQPSSAPLRYVRHVADMDGAAVWSGSWFSDFVGLRRASSAGTRPGTTTVHQIEWDMNPKEVPGTSCDGEDGTIRKQVPENFTITLQPGVPTDIVRASYRAIPPQTIESHQWASFWAEAHHQEEARHADAPAEDAQEDHPNPVFRIALKQTAPAEWRADFKRQHPGIQGFASLSEDGHLILRHVPKK